MTLLIRKILLLLLNLRKPRIRSMDVFIEQSFRVLPVDLDENFHMNHSRYLNYMELGRWELMIRTGFLKYALKNKIMAPVVNANVVYRRALTVFSKFQVQTRVLEWTDERIYLEHRVTRNSTLYTLGLIECRFIGRDKKVSFSEIVQSLNLDFGSNYRAENEITTQASSLARQMLKSSRETA